jgi:hypothetical protein
MKKLLMIVMACYGLTASAQEVDQSRNFIYLNSDSVIYADRITLRPDLLGSLQLRVDSRRIPIRDFRFLNNEDGFFANILAKTSIIETAYFAERIIKGRINLFQPVVYYPQAHGYSFRSRGSWVAGGSLRLYYNKGFEDLKTVNYRNLQADMSDNPESIALLEGYRKSMKTKRALYIASGASILVGTIASLALFDKNFNTASSVGFGLLGAGVVFATSGVYVNMASSRKLENAFDTYNR